MAFRHRVFQRLNRPGTRILLVLAGTVYKSLLYRRPCSVSYREGTWTHRHPDGVLVEPQISLATMTDLDQRAVDCFMFRYVPQPGDVVVDVGAGSGLETLPFSRRVGANGRVIAIEAHPLMFRCLQAVCHLNGLSNVTAVHAAVAAADHDVMISDTSNYQANTTMTGHGVHVPGRTLDSIVASLGIDRIDLLKMNIEGAERAAIEGMQRTIRITRHVAIGCHDFLADWGRGEMMRTKSLMVDFLRQQGFEIMLREDPRVWLRDTVYGRQPIGREVD